MADKDNLDLNSEGGCEDRARESAAYIPALSPSF